MQTSLVPSNPLSGMHAATNTHVARYFHAPSKRKNRTSWEPNLDYFQAQFNGHPERLKNLHFAFVVLLRAIRRASPFLSTYDYTLGAASGRATKDDAAAIVAGGANAHKLVQRLLDSAILKSCSGVFDAFDEGLLFREEQASWWSLKKQVRARTPPHGDGRGAPLRLRSDRASPPHFPWCHGSSRVSFTTYRPSSTASRAKSAACMPR